MWSGGNDFDKPGFLISQIEDLDTWPMMKLNAHRIFTELGAGNLLRLFDRKDIHYPRQFIR